MEKSVLTIIADNPTLIEALRKLLEKQFEIPVDMSVFPVTVYDEILGQYMRARITGMKAINDAFLEINRYKTVPDNKPKVNPAR